MRAGATVITTDTGEELAIPKSHRVYVLGDHTGRDPDCRDPTPRWTLCGSLRSNMPVFFQVSHELANDTPTDLLGFLAAAAAESLAQAFGDDLVNGYWRRKTHRPALDRRHRRHRPRWHVDRPRRPRHRRAGHRCALEFGRLGRRAVHATAGHRIPATQCHRCRHSPAQGHDRAACRRFDPARANCRLSEHNRRVHAAVRARRQIHCVRRLLAGSLSE